MMTKKDTISLSKKMAEKGFLCSEAVFKAIASAQGSTSELIPKVATGFAAGLGRSGEICGALSGAILGLGIKYGRNTPKDPPLGRRPYWFATELIQKFKERAGAVTCVGILGLDLSDPEDLETYYRLNHWSTTCRKLIMESTEIAWDLLQKPPEMSDM